MIATNMRDQQHLTLMKPQHITPYLHNSYHSQKPGSTLRLSLSNVQPMPPSLKIGT